MTLEPSESDPESPDLSTDPAPAEGASPGDGPSREYRATVGFTIGGLFTLVMLLVFAGVLSTTPPVRGLVVVAGVLLGTLAMLATAYGLAGGRRWAVAVATPMLLILIVTGAIEVLVALTHSSIDVPLGALLALWALRAPIRTPPDASGARPWGLAGALIVAAMVLGSAWPLTSGILLQSGGPLIAGADALLPSLVVKCDSEPGTPPTSIKITYDWRWARTEPWAAGADTVTLTAYTRREDGLSGYVLDSSEHGSPGTWQSDIRIGEQTGIVFGIDLSQAGFEPGSVGIGLMPAGELATGHGSVEISAEYLHGPADTSGPETPAIWKVRTPSRCEW